MTILSKWELELIETMKKNMEPRDTEDDFWDDGDTDFNPPPQKADFVPVKNHKEAFFDTLLRIGAIPAELATLRGTPAEKQVQEIGLTRLVQAAEFMADNCVREALASMAIVKADKGRKRRK